MLGHVSYQRQMMKRLTKRGGTMRFDDRTKALANLSWLFCFTVYFTNVTAKSLGVHLYPFFVG